jgi:hypothetical protein
MYKAYRIIDGKAKWVIVDKDERIVDNNPSKEELEKLQKEIQLPYSRKKKKYNESNTCQNIIDGEICGRILISDNALRERDEKGVPTGKWICMNCWKKNYSQRPDSYNNIIKLFRDRRTGCQDPDSSNAKGDLFQRVTCEWRHLEDLNIENDNYNSEIDHSVDPELGRIDTKGKFFNRYVGSYGGWPITVLKDHKKNYDYLIVYCVSKDKKYIERIYIFPKKEIDIRGKISIVKSPTKGGQWYEKYRVEDEEILNKVNEIWKKIWKG